MALAIEVVPRNLVAAAVVPGVEIVCATDRCPGQDRCVPIRFEISEFQLLLDLDLLLQRSVLLEQGQERDNMQASVVMGISPKSYKCKSCILLLRFHLRLAGPLHQPPVPRH